MRHCEVNYVCLEWVGIYYDFTAMTHTSFGETLGNNPFFTPMSAQAVSCAFYHCAKEFYDMSDDGIAYYEIFLKYYMGAMNNRNGQVTPLEVSLDSCSCQNELEAAYPTMNDFDSTLASSTGAQCVNDLSTGGLQSGGWMWYCEKLSCITAIESSFTDYFTCTMKDYYNVDWEACPTGMQWAMTTYGIGFGGQFVTHLLTIFTLTMISSSRASCCTHHAVEDVDPTNWKLECKPFSFTSSKAKHTTKTPTPPPQGKKNVLPLLLQLQHSFYTNPRYTFLSLPFLLKKGEEISFHLCLHACLYRMAQYLIIIAKTKTLEEK